MFILCFSLSRVAARLDISLYSRTSRNNTETRHQLKSLAELRTLGANARTALIEGRATMVQYFAASLTRFCTLHYL